MSKKTVQRRSQLITTFGPGAMVDLPTRSVLIGGLDRWRMPTGSYDEIDEPSLARLLERWLREQGRLDEGETIRLLTPPVDEGDDRGNPPGVDVTIFPTWFVCERVEMPTIDGEQKRGRRLVRWNELDPASGRRRFVHDDGKKDEVTPLRFVGACPNGHLQDIDWRQLLHAEPCREPIWLADRGTSGLLGDLEIVCSCGASLSMQEATLPGRLGLCEGNMPWIAAHSREDCTTDGRRTQLRLLTRSATNAYFAQTISIISLPPSEDTLLAIVERHRADLAEVESPEDVRQARRFNSVLRMALEGYSDTAVFERLQLIRTRAGEERAPNPRILEFDFLASGQDEIGVNARDARLYACTLPRSAWQADGGRDLGMIRSVVAVHRLREVMCLYGFTRLEPAPSASEGNLEEILLAVRGAPIAERTHWLPAVEQFGEGIFICFDPASIEAWQQQDEVRRRVDALIDGYRAHRRKYPNLAEREFPGGAYVMLHGLAHALIAEIALDCGYPASSLKERVYAFEPDRGQPRRCGILLYAVSLGAEGTLGGLVQSTRRLSTIIEHALERLAVCSNDPVCADHEPGETTDERALLGAACHGCLLIPETSCERRNNFLDRSLLVETMARNRSGVFE
jgi:hypothetical protein